MANVYKVQDQNIRKTWFLMTGFLVFVIFVGWGASLVFDSRLILYVAIIFSLFMNFFSYWYSDKVVLRISGAKKISRESDRELWNIVENLSIASGLPMPRLYIIADPAPNAFATGRNPEHSAVAVTSGLLARLERSEIEGVIAHELAHIQNRDILLQTTVVVLVGFLTLLSDFFLRAALYGGAGGNRNGGNVAFLLIGIALIILSPIIGKVIQLAISRKREFLADATGALLTRYPEGLARALEKISGYQAPLKRANHATAHMYISNPYGQKAKTGFLNRLFMTHPPVEERITALLGKV